MGFFSWDCKGCKHSIRSNASTNAGSAWMKFAVLVSPEGDVMRGEYDGYGQLHGRYEVELADGPEPSLYHQACYSVLGKPQDAGPSKGSNDQGYFVGEYDPAEPQSVADVQALVLAAEEKLAADREDVRKYREEMALKRAAGEI